MKVLIALCLTITAVACDPPGSNQYLPPPTANKYGAPSQEFSSQNAFSQTYQEPSYGGQSPNYAPQAFSAPQAPASSFSAASSSSGFNDDQSEPANYQFEYMVKDDESGNDFGHMESRQDDLAQGKYYVVLPDGRKQIVEYEADSNGYRPKISYEEGFAKFTGGAQAGSFAAAGAAGLSGAQAGGFSGMGGPIVAGGYNFEQSAGQQNNGYKY